MGNGNSNGCGQNFTQSLVIILKVLTRTDSFVPRVNWIMALQKLQDRTTLMVCMVKILVAEDTHRFEGRRQQHHSPGVEPLDRKARQNSHCLPLYPQSPQRRRRSTCEYSVPSVGTTNTRCGLVRAPVCAEKTARRAETVRSRPRLLRLCRVG